MRSTRPMGWPLIVYDVIAVSLSVAASFVIRFETADLASALGPFILPAALPIVVRPMVAIGFGLYRRQWRFASIRELRDMVLAVGLGSLIIGALFAGMAVIGAPGTSPFPRSFFVIEPLITLALVGGARFALRIATEERNARHPRDRRLTRTIVYGAGEAGASVARSSRRDPQLNIAVVAFLDDDPMKRGSRLHGTPVMGGIERLPEVAEQTDAEQLLVAMPSQAGSPVRRAVELAHAAGLDVKIMPPLRNLLTGQFQPAAPRSVAVEDLLRRRPVELDTSAMAAYLNGASVVVTGAGGSIGGELVRQILRLGPRVLTVIDYHEAALWGIERDAMALLRTRSAPRLTPVLADIRSPVSIEAAFVRARPDVVFHAAALKHVPYVELHPSEGVLTNVDGTRNVLAAAEVAGCDRFVMISTDKAVEPASVMGWTKRLAELLTIRDAQERRLNAAAVRFGNVLGSSGSLVPLLERQLVDGLPLTVTDPNATRYFMTLGEAVTLILEAGAATESGAVYVLDMGQPLRIGDLVRDLVRMHELDPDEVEIRTTGLRPGEKLHEQLFFRFERRVPTSFAGITRAILDPDVMDELAVGLDAVVDHLVDAARRADDEEVRQVLRSLRRRDSAAGMLSAAS